MELDPVNTETMPRRMSIPDAVDWLRSRHGGDKARRLARLEQQKARRARSRKRFAYWAAVAAELELASPVEVRAVPAKRLLADATVA